MLAGLLHLLEYGVDGHEVLVAEGILNLDRIGWVDFEGFGDTGLSNLDRFGFISWDRSVFEGAAEEIADGDSESLLRFDGLDNAC